MNKVIFLDAVGTLFGTRGTVGELYAQQALKFGVEVSAEALNRAFFKIFQEVPPAAFPGIKLEEIPRCEFEWWQAIFSQTFQRVGVWEQFSDFNKFFAQLYAYFATDEPWFVYPDVIGALESWQKQEFQLGVISNFDSRLYLVLEQLNLAEFFTSITISTEVGAAKPNSQIFRVALEKHNCLAEEALHVGDSLKDDCEGGRNAGLKTVWLQRGDRLPRSESANSYNGKIWTELCPYPIVDNTYSP